MFGIGGIYLRSSSSSINLNGSGSVTCGDESFLATCSKGGYYFYLESSVLLNFGGGVVGGSVSTSSSIEHVGQFASHVDFAGSQLISLHSIEQGTFVFSVNVVDGAVFLDQTAYQQTDTSEEQCG